MSFNRTGSCSQCGECCKADVIAQFMHNLAHTQCKYLIKKNGTYDCEITAGKFENPEDLVFKELIPKKDFDYWKQECQPYPDSEKEEHTKPIHTLPAKCTYNIGEVE